MSAPRWAVTLFSYTNELLEADSSADELLDRVLRDGVADLVEIDAAQHFRTFPLLDLDEVASTAAVVRSARGAVSVLGGGADLYPAPGVRLDDAAALAQLATQVAAARLLGAEAVRIAFGVLPSSLLHEAAALARSAGVVLLEEVQGPETPDDPRLTARIADLERSGEDSLRLLLDTSALMSALPAGYLAALRAHGVPDHDVERLSAAFLTGGVAPVVLPHLADAALAPAAKSLLVTAMTRFGHGTADAWDRLAPFIGGVHLKWWDLPLAADDLAGETGGILERLFADGFTGAVCSEWGGHEWESSAVSAAEQTVAHARLFAARFSSTALVPQVSADA